VLFANEETKEYALNRAQDQRRDGSGVRVEEGRPHPDWSARSIREPVMGTKKPTHLLKVKERNGEGRTTIGAGWLNPDGSMSIQLNPCVSLTSHDDVVINLFPILEDDDPRPRPSKAVRPQTYKPSGVVIPEKDANKHEFVEINTTVKTSIQRCVNCDHRIVVDVPYAGCKPDVCPRPMDIFT
jgi:hypothetical protein